MRLLAQVVSMQPDSDSVKVFPILSLDGGGARGAFTLGVLSELEAHLGGRLVDHFRLIYGTSTGAIIATYLALGCSVADIYKNYMEIIPCVMSKKTARGRSAALGSAAEREFGKHTFADVRCMLAIVATRCDFNRPLIFKSDVELAHGRAGSFVPGFGVPLADCLMASAAATPFFERHRINLSGEQEIEAMDGGFVANNPSLFALIDAEQALSVQRKIIRLCSIGTGEFPSKEHWWDFFKGVWPIALLEETLESNSNTIDIVRKLLFSDVATVRINRTFSDSALATDLLESSPIKLRTMYKLGREAFGADEASIRAVLGEKHATA